MLFGKIQGFGQLTPAGSTDDVHTIWLNPMLVHHASLSRVDTRR